mmetsp:Transcript_93089/g.245703  ORF Transcript_93089/g.245703 Transcript_93089/m.245703 type:complete len:265 (-) Transcript_93089:168-962(-)
MQLGPGSGGRRVIHVQADVAKGFQNIALYDGMSTSDVHECLRVAAGLDHDEDFLLYDTGEVLVPVSAALPGGLRLALRRVEAPQHHGHHGGGGSGVSTEAPASSPSTSPSPAAKEKGSLTPTTKAFVKEMTGHTEAMKNFGKISNYLANDRTLLAWTRTSLALARTTFAIAALAAASEGWLLALNFVTISLACLTVTFFMVGCIRFIDVRMALDSDQPPLFMLSRFSNSARSFWSPRRVIPVHILLGATVALISVAAAGKEFHK